MSLNHGLLVGGEAKDTQPQSGTWPVAKQGRREYSGISPPAFLRTATRAPLAEPTQREPGPSLQRRTEQGTGRGWVWPAAHR